MTADNKYLCFIRKNWNINSVMHIYYSIFIHNLLLFPKIQVIGRRYLIPVWQSRTENYQEIWETSHTYRSRKLSIDIEFLNNCLNHDLCSTFLKHKMSKRSQSLTHTHFDNALLYRKKLKLWRLRKFVHNWIKWRMI